MWEGTDFKNLCGQVYRCIKGKTQLKQAPRLWENSNDIGLLSQWCYYIIALLLLKYLMEGSLQAKED